VKVVPMHIDAIVDSELGNIAGDVLVVIKLLFTGTEVPHTTL